MQSHDTFQILSQIHAVLGLALGKGVFPQMRVAQAIDTGQHPAKVAAVVDDAAKANPVITAFRAR